MSWWDLADLTPVAAWDALRADAPGTIGRKLLDGVGSNHINSAGHSIRTAEMFAVAGTNNPMPFTSTITFPVNYVIASFVRANSRYVGFYKELTSGYIFNRENTSNMYFSITTTASTISCSYDWGVATLVALAVTPSGNKLFVDGVAVVPSLPAGYLPSYIKGIGWTGNGNEYNLDTTDRFHAAGVWAGLATDSSMSSLNSQLRAYIAAPTPSRLLMSPLIHNRGSLYPRPGFSFANNPAFDILARRTVNGGYFVVSGTVREDGAPAEKYLRIYERRNHVCRGGKFSRADGTYEFTGLSPDIEYYVLVFDGNRVYPAQIQDRIVYTAP